MRQCNVEMKGRSRGQLIDTGGAVMRTRGETVGGEVIQGYGETEVGEVTK